MSEKIRECPVPHAFADPTPPRLDNDSEFGFYVHCPECSAFGPYSDSGAGAIAAWNHRPREERLVKLLGRAQTTCDGIAGHQCCCELCRADATRMSAAIAVELGERP